MTTPTTPTVTYVAANCYACQQLVLCWSTPDRTGHWMHQNPADQEIGGWHPAGPGNGTTREITAGEYLNLGGPL